MLYSSHSNKENT